MTLTAVLIGCFPIISILIALRIVESYSGIYAVLLVLGELLLTFFIPLLVMKYLIKAKCPDCQSKMRRTGIDKVKYTREGCKKFIKLPEFGQFGKLKK